MAPTSPTLASALGVSSAPTFSPETILVIGIALLFVVLSAGTAGLVSVYRRRITRARPQAPARDMVDLEHQARTMDTNGTDDGKNGSRILAFPPLAVLARSRSASTMASVTGPPALGKFSLDLPPPAVAVAPSSRLRDSVLVKALGQLTWPTLDKAKHGSTPAKCIIDLEAAAHTLPPSLRSLASDSSLSYPEWVRPHLPEIREQAKREWTLYTPTAQIAIPEIVIQSFDDDVPIPDSPASTYSTNSAPSELDTPPPMTPTLASPVSFYFPASPSFSPTDYLQVPPPSFNAPREEEMTVLRNVSNFSGKTFALAAPPARFSKLGGIRERRMLARAQAASNAANDKKEIDTTSCFQIVKGCGTGPRVTVGDTSSNAVVVAQQAAGTGMRVAGVGLGLQLRPQLDFQGSLDNALASSAHSGNDGVCGLSATFSTADYLDFASTLAVSQAATTNVVIAAVPARQVDAKAKADPSVAADAFVTTNVSVHADDANANIQERPERLARLIDAFDSTYSLASLDSDGGHGRLCDILGLGDFLYDGDRSFEHADADDSAVTEVFVQETSARRAVVVHAI
ncbi:hypothetical protein C8Q77DRAFT_1054987 [Trametes polyzona]|nr:hypothetical protein C8Q77DRAFT_1054987 [Trametes polyzona]